MLTTTFRVWLQDPRIPPVWTGVKLLAWVQYVKGDAIEVTVEGNGDDFRRLIAHRQDIFAGYQLGKKFPHTNEGAAELPVDVTEHHGFALTSTSRREPLEARTGEPQRQTLRVACLRGFADFGAPARLCPHDLGGLGDTNRISPIEPLWYISHRRFVRQERMHSEALPIGWIFQPSRSQSAWRRLFEWLRKWAARRLDRRNATRKMLPNLVAHYFDGTAAATHIVRDVSNTGAFIYAAFHWPPGTIVKLTLELTCPVDDRNPPPPRVLRTRVIRYTPRGLAIQFLFLKKADRRDLTNFLREIPESFMKQGQAAKRQEKN